MSEQISLELFVLEGKSLALHWWIILASDQMNFDKKAKLSSWLMAAYRTTGVPYLLFVLFASLKTSARVVSISEIFSYLCFGKKREMHVAYKSPCRSLRHHASGLWLNDNTLMFLDCHAGIIHGFHFCYLLSRTNSRWMPLLVVFIVFKPFATLFQRDLLVSLYLS